MHIKENEEVMIFKNDKDFYTIGLSRKDRNGQYFNGYFPCQFKKGVSLESRTKIKLKNAFISFYLKDNETKTYLMILDYSLIDNKEDYLQMKNEMEENNDMPF